ncbi:E3 ubiquitin-protein ligase ctrip isoform X2 [Brevipalpus obovatus]|uniref:E3 ubiquitin-protein ligase ctrip isoform X2 n=1 Tax=Brevipalpus obovatus TaxID=246614 RepID=UPI003D9F88D6
MSCKRRDQLRGVRRKIEELGEDSLQQPDNRKEFKLDSSDLSSNISSVPNNTASTVTSNHTTSASSITAATTTSTAAAAATTSKGDTKVGPKISSILTKDSTRDTRANTSASSRRRSSRLTGKLPASLSSSSSTSTPISSSSTCSSSSTAGLNHISQPERSSSTSNTQSLSIGGDSNDNSCTNSNRAASATATSNSSERRGYKSTRRSNNSLSQQGQYPSQTAIRSIPFPNRPQGTAVVPSSSAAPSRGDTKIGSKISSNSSKDQRDARTGTSASSRRRSSRLTGRLPASGLNSLGQGETSSISSSSSSSASGGTSGLSSGHSSSYRDSLLVAAMEDRESGAKNTNMPGSSLSGTSGSLGGSAAPSSLSMSAPVGGGSDESEMGRLQALLEARGLPPHLFGALGPRVQHLLHRSMGNNTTSKAHQLIQGLQAQGDEGQQLQAVMEMCQLLVMGNEDTLAGFPAKQAVPALISLLQLEQNFDIMNHSCRALTYMMESLPRSSAVVVDAIPAFLEKLQFIQCMDVAEQSLTALEILSRRHSKAILHAGGVPACLSYLDFFTINAQRAALSITANCCQNLNKDEFSFVQESLATLSSHLIKYQDKKCLESLCLAFSRLVDSFQHYSSLLKQITENNLLNNVQQLLLVSPPIISSGTFVMVIRMLATMCASCPILAVQLLKLNISDTIRYLLLGSSATSEFIELASRSPQELYELTSLIGELMPQLPTDGIFSADAYSIKQVNQLSSEVTWQWKDDRGLWHNYNPIDNRMLEAASHANEDEVSLSTMGRTYIVDFNSMQQINEDTGTSRSVQRLVNSVPDPHSSPDVDKKEDARIKCLRGEPELAQAFIKSLFGVLYEVYSSSAGPSVRHKCIRALLRIIYYSPPDLLREVLKNHSVSSHIAAMLPSPDLRVVVGAMQMVYILMDKLPDIFSIYFRREGVTHQLKKLIQSDNQDASSSTPSSSKTIAITSSSNLSTNAKCEPIAGPSTSSLYTQRFSSSCFLETSSSAPLSNISSLQTFPSCDVPTDFFVPNDHFTSGPGVPPSASNVASLHFWDNGPSNVAHSTSSCASSQSLSSINSEHLAQTAVLPSSSMVSLKNSENTDSRASQMKLADVLKRKRTSKKASSNSFTSSSATSRKSRNEIESSLSSYQMKGCVPSTPNLTSNQARLDYESLTNSGSRVLTPPYISMPFLAYSSTPTNATTGAPGSSSTINNSSIPNNNNNPAETSCSSSASSAPLPINPSLPMAVSSSNHVLISGSAGANRGRPSKLSSAAAKTSSFFANLYPARWKRWNNANSSIIGANAPNLSARQSMLLSQSQDHLGSLSGSSSPRSPNNNGNKEKIRQWVREQAKAFLEKYFNEADETNEAMSTLNRINAAMEIFDKDKDLEALKEFRTVLTEGDISPFELIHCGIIKKLIHYLTHEDKDCVDRDTRIRRFLSVFLGTPVDDSFIEPSELDLKLDTSSLIFLVSKLNACISQLEQFPVRVHDIIGTGTGNIRGTSALKFFNTHQLKCNLQRHRDCVNLKQWVGGPVKIDPLALVQAIERYLLLRGFGRVREEDDDNSDDDNSDEDFEDNMTSVVVNQGQGRHKLQFLIDGHVLPYNMTVYQAIRQFSSSVNSHFADGHDTDGDFEGPIGHANMWVQTHTIYYRQYEESENPSPSRGASRASSMNIPSNMNIHSNVNSSSNSGHSFATASVSSCSNANSRRSSKTNSSRSASSRKKDELWLEGKPPPATSTVYNVLSPTLPSCFTISDASLEVITLMRIVNALNRSWAWFYNLNHAQNPAIPQTEFVNSKLTAKANRQLQDPLVIMTGNLPNWLSQIAYVCPFLFPFETRHLLFYVTSFDRDRALQRLLDSTPGLNSNDSTERVTPRLDKRKKTVTREDILRQAETVFHDVGNTKALLEIQYDNEVGTGLGPTLEFYALVSRELQRADLEMWRGDVVSAPSVIIPPSSSDKISSGPSGMNDIQVIKTRESKKETPQVQYVYSPGGLFPSPIGKPTKSAHVSKVKSRYKLLGKFMGKAISDSRMVDIPLSILFYKWLLGQEHSLTASDMRFLDPTFAKSIMEMDNIAQRKKKSGQEFSRESLTLGGVSIEDLNLDFTLPGFPHIELRKGGKDLSVTSENIDEYLRLLVHWTMVEGVSRQMEAFKEGFESVLSLSQLQIFYPEELEQLFCGSGHQPWDIKTLIDCCHPDHGYTYDSKAIKFLFEVLSDFNPEDQRKFLQFVTGSPRLPVGGLKSLTPPLTIVRKTFEPGENPDDYLPSVMTCVNYLKLPDYSSIEVMREKLMIAANEGQHSFHLS